MDVNGTPEDIAAVLRNLGQVRGGKEGKAVSGQVAPAGRPLLRDLILSLADGAFFKKPRDLAAIKSALEQMGHTYPTTTLSPAVLRLVRIKRLRRIRENGHWHYTL